MEFLFLNESAGFDNDSSSYKDMVTFAESQGVDIAEDATKSLTEVMLEAEEGFHEAEMTAMREEFALYQESLQESDDPEVLQEGFLSKVGSKLKQWWEAIKKFLIKLWGKIVHAFWAAVTWMRKTIQAAIQKFNGTNTIFIPKSLEPVVKDPAKDATKLHNFIAGLSTMIVRKATTSDDKITIKNYEKMLNDAKLMFNKKKEEVKKDWEEKKGKIKGGYKKETDDKGNISLKQSSTEYTGKMVAIPFSAWKSGMDKALKSFEAAKKGADSAEKALKSEISRTDKLYEQAYKAEDGKASTGQTAEQLRSIGNWLRVCSSVMSKTASATIGWYRWVMGALFHYSTYSNKKKNTKTIDV